MDRERMTPENDAEPAKKKWPAWVFLFVLLLLVAAVVCAYWFLFRVKIVESVPSAHYAAEDIVEAAAIPDGAHLYSFSSRDVEERIKRQCPYVKSIEVTRTMPDTISIRVIEDSAVFYATFFSETWALSADLRLLERISDADAAERELLCLRLPEIAAAVAGKPIEFRKGENVGYVYDVLEAVIGSGLFSRLNRVDLGDKSALVMIADGLYRLEFGSVADCAVKLQIAEAVLRDELFENGTRARLDLSKTSETSVIIDPQISLD